MSVSQAKARYYVVGGPVQPDRDCYVLRDADAMLYGRLAEGEYCHVLAAPDTGKTSLVAYAAAQLRGDGVLVANVDLAQISNRDVTDDVGRWYYSVAYRIVRELRIRFDMQAWWVDRAALTNLQRLRDFFREVVLAETEAPVVIFVDRIETALGVPASLDLFGAIRACYDARATDPEYRRLSFALLGSAPPGKLIPTGQESPFDVSVPIPLADFDLDEVVRLAAGLPCDARTARALAERVWYWTAGHPYLSQKLLRALSRRPVSQYSDADVDQWVTNLFLTRNAIREEPHLSMVRNQLLRDTRTRVARLSVYGKVRKGGRVASDHAAPTHRDLLRVGLLVEDSDGNLTLRNRVYAEVFSAHWVNRNLPFSPRGLGVAALLVLAVVALPVWYTEYLPRPYIRTLTTPGEDFVSALDAYRRLGFLPGFGTTADRLFSDYLAGQSRRAGRLIEVQRYNELLTEMPGREALAAQLLADFWDRRREEALRRGERDDALLYALQAMATPTPARRAALGQLYGDDFRQLLGSLRPGPAPVSAELDPLSGLLTVLDGEHRLAIWQPGRDGLRRVQNLQLLAEEVIPLPARAVLEGSGNGSRLVLRLGTDHPRPTDLRVEIRAPSGRAARLAITDAMASGRGEYRLDSRRDRALRPLLEESVAGTWTVYFNDTVQGVAGRLTSWRLEVDGRAAVPVPGSAPEGALIPEPIAARQAVSVLAPAGRRALTWPADPAVRGDILVWNAGTGEVVARVPRPAGFSAARFALGQAAVLVTGGRTLELWGAERGEFRLSIPFDPTFAPVLSADGRYLVVDALLTGNENALTVWDLARAREVGRLVTGGVARLAVPAPGGRVLAVSDGESLVRLWDVAAGRLVGELAHGATPTGVIFAGDGSWLATTDASQTLRLWRREDTVRPALVRASATPWEVAFDAGAALIGNLDRGYEVLDLPALDRRGPLLRHGVPAPRGGAAAGAARLAGAAGLAMTWDGDTAMRVWRLPAAGAVPAELAAAGPGLASLSPDGRRLAFPGAAGDLRILPTAEQALVLPARGRSLGFIGHLGPVTAVAFAADGELVASGGLDGGLRLWDADSGAPRSFFASHGDGAVLDLAFTPDGRQLVSASRASVLVTDAATGETLARRAIQSQRPRLVLSEDGQAVYVAGDREGLTVWLWRADVAETLVGADPGVRALAVAPGGERFATVDAARRVRLWGTDLAALPEQVRLPAAVERLWFTADGRELVVQGGTWLHRLRVRPDGLQHEASRLLPEAPLAALPAPAADGVLLLEAVRNARPVLRLLEPGAAAAPPESAPVDALQPRVEQALGLRLSDWGEPEPLSGG